jgi:hypothetical protein
MLVLQLTATPYGIVDDYCEVLAMIVNNYFQVHRYSIRENHV